MVIEEDREKLIESESELIDGEIHSAEIRVRAEDGTILTLVISAKMIFENEEPNKIVGTTLDITELKLKDMNAYTVEAAMRSIEGTARSMGIDVVDG